MQIRGNDLARRIDVSVILRRCITVDESVRGDHPQYLGRLRSNIHIQKACTWVAMRFFGQILHIENCMHGLALHIPVGKWVEALQSF